MTSAQQTVQASTGANSVEPSAFYNTRSKDLRDQVQNFDIIPGHTAVRAVAENAAALNLVLNYGPKSAWCVCNVSEDALSELVQKPPPTDSDSAWIQLWYPHKQKKVIEALASKYEFSPRLRSLMQSDPRRQSTHREPPQASHHHYLKKKHKSPRVSTNDIEISNGPTSPKVPVGNTRDAVRHLNHYDVVTSIWHWSSIDTNKKYFCLGYNSLHNVRPDPSQDNEARGFVPLGQRIWTWLILCNDKTVISITESPFDQPLPTSPIENASETRKNTLNVLDQLSATFDMKNTSPISIIPIRELLQDGAIDTDGAAGLLFYYLFDDWYSTYGLLAKSGHRYGAELNIIRRKMKEKASLERVDELYCLGRQLAVLKLVYQSYMQLIQKLLVRQKDHDSKYRQSDRGGSVAVSTHNPTLGPHTTSTEHGAVNLVPQAQDRFERLGDRITLYVISEIQECIDIKDSLLSMNFNLISIKESDAVERLTRITLLLGKATILFLPVSLMSQYFSVNFNNAVYTTTQFWVAFAVLLIISFFTLFVFDRISDFSKGDMAWQSVTTISKDYIKGFFTGKRRKKQSSD